MHNKHVMTVVAVAVAVVLTAMPSLPESDASVAYDDVFEIYGTTVLFVFNGGEALTIEWNFGDGHTSTAWNPQHTYTAIGTYTVSQTVYNTYDPLGTGEGSYSTAYYKVIIHGPPWVTFESNGGTPMDRIQMSHGGQSATAAPKPTDPSKDGFTFDGWYTDSSLRTGYDWDTKVILPIHLFAKWTAVVTETHTVTLISEGKEYTSYDIASGETAQASSGPDREGYRFVGWYTDSNLETEYDWNTPVTKDINLYAKWDEIVLYEMTFDSTDIPAQTVEQGHTATKPADPLRVGYEFEGWYTDPDLRIAYDWDATVTQDITLYPKWTVLEFDVTFDGTDLEPITVEYGRTISEPTDPTRDGYTFDGWYTDRAYGTEFDWTAPIVADTVVYAKWTPIVHTITFSGATMDPITVNHGAVATIPTDPTRNGYTFGGWYTDPAWTQRYIWTTPVTNDFTLYAKWTVTTGPGPETFTITFDSKGGSSVSSQTVRSGERASKPTDPTRDGYTFDGWYTDSTCRNAYIWTAPVTKNITLYAGWTEVPVEFTITFSGADVSPIKVQDGSVASKPTDPTRSGYVFIGWFTDPSYTVAYDWSEPVTADIALYAKWTVQSYVLVIVYGNGTPDGSVMVPYGSPIDGYLPEDIVREGYTFDGWSDHPETMPASKVTVTASWNPMGEDEDDNLLYIIAAALVVIALIAAIVFLRRRA